jgi:hypothetical protein
MIIQNRYSVPVGYGKSTTTMAFSNLSNEQIKEFLEKDCTREITIKRHVSGYRVELSDLEYGQIVSCTGSFDKAYSDCMKYFEDNIKIKIQEKMDRLERRKKEALKSLEEINEELTNIRLSIFKNEKNNRT